MFRIENKLVDSREISPEHRPNVIIWPSGIFIQHNFKLMRRCNNPTKKLGCLRIKMHWVRLTYKWSTIDKSQQDKGYVMENSKRRMTKADSGYIAQYSVGVSLYHTKLPTRSLKYISQRIDSW